MAIRVITDSSADFDAAVAKRRKIDIVPMTIQFGSASFVAGKTISNDVFYQLLQESKTFPSTSQPTPAAFLRDFEEAKASGDQAVVVLLSGALSGTLQSAEIAKEMCGYEPIYIVDSVTATAGIQILVNLACKLRDSGLPAAAIARELEAIKEKIRIFAVVDTLEYLRRGGRRLPGRVGRDDQAEAHHRRSGRRGGCCGKILRYGGGGEASAEDAGGSSGR